MKIEQRIGRLDRIGQKHPVEIFNFAIEGTLEDQVLRVLHERIQIFETTVGSLDPILGSMESEVRDLLLKAATGPQDGLHAFEDRLIQRIREAHEMESKLGDFILDTRSFRRDRADALIGRKPVFTSADIQQFVLRFLHHTSGHIRDRGNGVFDLHLPRSMRGGGRELQDTYTVTFDPEIAQRQERLDFVAFGHDVLDRAVELCLADSFEGKAAFLRIRTAR